MSASTEYRERERGTPPADLQIASWPLRNEGYSAWLMLLGAGGIALLAGFVAQSWPLGILCLAVLLLSLWRLWLPVRYDFGPRGLAETVLGRQRRIAWSHIARYEIRRRGVLLLATHEQTPLRALQGRYIPWGCHRLELQEMVRFYLDR